MQLPPPPPPPTFGYRHAGATPPSRRSMLATAGGITAIVALLVILAACILPYANYDSSDGGPASPSIFNGGYPGSWSNILEPAVVILFTLVAGVMLIASTYRISRALTSGALLAMGASDLRAFLWLRRHGHRKWSDWGRQFGGPRRGGRLVRRWSLIGGQPADVRSPDPELKPPP